MANKGLLLPSARLFNNSNRVASGATATLYLSGTSTLTNFLDAEGVALGPTITADGLGQLPSAYQDENTAFRLIVRDALGVQLDGGDIDPFYFGRDNTASEATDSQVWTGSDTATRISPRRIFTAAAPVSLTDGATITIDGNTGINFKVTLGGNRTLANPTNMKTGQSGLVIVTQDATGSRTLSYGTNWKFPGGAASGGVLSTTASAVDVISYFVRSDGTILANLTKAYS